MWNTETSATLKENIAAYRDNNGEGNKYNSEQERTHNSDCNIFYHVLSILMTLPLEVDEWCLCGQMALLVIRLWDVPTVIKLS
jgi:hypothetical protein